MEYEDLLNTFDQKWEQFQTDVGASLDERDRTLAKYFYAEGIRQGVEFTAQRLKGVLKP